MSMKFFAELKYEGLFSFEEFSFIKMEIAKFRSTSRLLKNYDSDFNVLLDMCFPNLRCAKMKYRMLTKSLIARVIERVLKNILRWQKTTKQYVNYDKKSLDEEIVNEETQETYTLVDIISDNTNFESEIIFKYDFQQKLKNLSKIHQQIFGLLEKEYSKDKIAKMLKKRKSRITDEIKRMETIFFEEI